MSDWSHRFIRDLFRFHTPGEWGNNPTGGDRDVLVLRSTNFSNDGYLNFSSVVTRSIPERKLSRCILDPGDILLEKSGGGPDQAVGRVAIYEGRNGRYGCANFIERMCVASGIHPKYVLYKLLQCYRDGLTTRFEQQTTGIRNLKLQDLLNEVIAIAPLPEQHKIARILTTLDQLIEKTEALIAKYQSIKQGMMHDLFARGIDEHGRLRPPQSEAPDLYKQSELGWIPREWWVATIGDLFDKRTEHGREGLPVMSVVMKDGLVMRSSVDRRVESNLPPHGHALVLRNDIAYNMMRMWQGVLGRASFDCLVSPAYVVLKPKDTINSRFAAFLFSDKQSIQKFRQYSQGVVDDRLRLYFHDLVQIPFALPTSLDEQEVIASRIEVCNQRIATERSSLEQYQCLRQGLMQDLLTGTVRVRIDGATEDMTDA